MSSPGVSCTFHIKSHLSLGKSTNPFALDEPYWALFEVIHSSTFFSLLFTFLIIKPLLSQYSGLARISALTYILYSFLLSVLLEAYAEWTRYSLFPRGMWKTSSCRSVSADCLEMGTELSHILIFVFPFVQELPAQETVEDLKGRVFIITI